MRNRKKIFVLALASVLLCSGALVGAVYGKEATELKRQLNLPKLCNCDPSISLPSDPVTMIVYQPGSNSYFDTHLLDVPSGYDVTIGCYLGCCAQEGLTIPRGVPHLVKLYSSYDPDMPQAFEDEDWDKINYIVNNKRGDRMDVQEAIWYFINDRPTRNSISVAMIQEADRYGEGFCPSPGDVMVIILDSGRDLNPVVQGIIIEVPIPLLEYVDS